ncbi:hypothetical protein J8J14_04835 [Roseomonas sp. SSH11]|uniref:Uncharacterized protein n=1 Tax=Pararoseomonas baculiformis TaxID=2820812 RepID=A0ABS4AAS0_9PROT|nr:DUF6152 family protein [Pararoseomonas baculiformis]MBP0444097.1 hypothetical protein [Pararoseomonas baculiformis]
MNRRAFLGGLAVLLGAGRAQAHHGWSWAEAEQMELTGTIREVSIAPPHPTLRVEGPDGVWTVELGNPSQTSRAGFVEGVARPGDRIVARGNRSQNQNERRMKAVQVTVGDRRYDIYPERIQGG